MVKSNAGKAGKPSRARRTAIIVIAVIAIALIGLLTWPERKAAYPQLVQARSAEARFSRWEKSAMFRLFRQITKSDPESHFRQMAEVLEAALCKSRELIWVDFFAQSLPAQIESATTNRMVLGTYAPAAPGSCENKWSSPVAQRGLPCARYCYHYGGRCHLLCRPSDLAFWQSAFGSLTNRIRWMAISGYAGGSDERAFYLPDGSKVDLAHCQQWLNDSIREGWKVGLMSTNSPEGERWFVAFRQR